MPGEVSEFIIEEICVLAAHEAECGGRDLSPAAEKVGGDEDRCSTGCQCAESTRTTSDSPRHASPEQPVRSLDSSCQNQQYSSPESAGCGGFPDGKKRGRPQD